MATFLCALESLLLSARGSSKDLLLYGHVGKLVDGILLNFATLLAHLNAGVLACLPEDLIWPHEGRRV